MAYATTADYEVRLKIALSPSEGDQVAAWLDDVSAVIKSRLKTVEPDADVARMITVGVVHRIVSNPAFARTRQSGGVSVTFAVVNRMITEDEWDSLTGVPAAPEAYSVQVRDDAYWPL